ncbi:MAG: hypothetical protein Q8Q09_14775 [Deltaproteobacteria bacterium]|nr:hypothetical protein [Deltaproteobacteria bacterium]
MNNTHSRLTLVGLFALFATLAGCSNKLTGSLTIDARVFRPTSCNSGQALGFAGVELHADDDDRRVRIVSLPTTQTQVVVLGGGTIVQLSNCGLMNLETQNSTVNDVRNVRGNVMLQCTDGVHNVSGAITFENCH